METLEISMKKKTKPQILDIDKAIENLKKHLPSYKSEVEVYQDEALIHKSHITRFLGITRPTLDKWIQEGFFEAVKSKYLPRTYFYPPEEILKQLLQLKD